MSRLPSRALIGLFSMGTLAILGVAGPAAAAIPSSAPTIVHNQSNLSAASADSPQVVLAAVPEGWVSGGTQFKSRATCVARGNTLVDLNVAATFLCQYNSRTGKYELWYSKACLDIVAPDPNI